MADQTTQLLLVRHGETAANVEGRMQGRGDDPLNERGMVQARAVANRINREFPHISAIYSSPLGRARATADAIGAALGLTPRLRDGLQEMNIGRLDGVSPTELWAAAPRDADEAYPGGESGREFVERIMGALYGIVSAHRGETVVAVSHGGVIATALSIWAHGHGGGWQAFVPPNCALTIVQFRGNPDVRLINDCTHL
jgi:broad specificity phosphatase PhoE